MTLSDPAVASSPATDKNLVDRARAGDPGALEELILRHRRGAYRLALQLMGNPDDAFDATQDGLIKFVTSLGRFSSDRPVRPWLYAIVRNRCRDLLRRRRVRRWQPLESIDGVERPELADTTTSPFRDVARNELRDRIWAALARLGPEHREIVVLRDYQDLTYDEIAATLGIPRGTVMSRLHRARKKLAQLLSHHPATSLGENDS